MLRGTSAGWNAGAQLKAVARASCRCTTTPACTSMAHVLTTWWRCWGALGCILAPQQQGAARRAAGRVLVAPNNTPAESLGPQRLLRPLALCIRVGGIPAALAMQGLALLSQRCAGLRASCRDARGRRAAAVASAAASALFSRAGGQSGCDGRGAGALRARLLPHAHARPSVFGRSARHVRW